MTEKALELGGTRNGEHGEGIRKIKYQEAENWEVLPLMREVKELFYPLGLLNSGRSSRPRLDCYPNYLGVKRADDVVLVEITTQRRALDEAENI
jgi:hypothetical protein